jgi:hypothetical protein
VSRYDVGDGVWNLAALRQRFDDGLSERAAVDDVEITLTSRVSCGNV